MLALTQVAYGMCRVVFLLKRTHTAGQLGVQRTSSRPSPCFSQVGVLLHSVLLPVSHLASLSCNLCPPSLPLCVVFSSSFLFFAYLYLYLHGSGLSCDVCRRL